MQQQQHSNGGITCPCTDRPPRSSSSPKPAQKLPICFLTLRWIPCLSLSCMQLGYLGRCMDGWVEEIGKPTRKSTNLSSSRNHRFVPDAFMIKHGIPGPTAQPSSRLEITRRGSPEGRRKRKTSDVTPRRSHAQLTLPPRSEQCVCLSAYQPVELHT